MGTVRKPSGWPAFGLFLLLFVGFGVAQWWGDRRERVNPVQAPAPGQEEAQAARRSASAQAALALQRDAEGCLVPSRFVVVGARPERGGVDEWRTSSAGDRLRVDDCGHVWALWFNSWMVLRKGEPEAIGYVGLPGSGVVAALSQSGVASFLSTPQGELWLLGRNGDTTRYRDGLWQRLPSRPGCSEGQLLRVDGEIWLACGDAGLPLTTWREDTGQWQPRPALGKRAVQRLALTPEGKLHALSGGRVFARDAGPEQETWVEIARVQAPAGVKHFSVDARRFYFALAEGLRIVERDSGAQAEAFAGRRVTGIVTNGRGGAWVSVAGFGLHYFDGRVWADWRYAHGLPDDEARDVLIDAQSRLWLAGSRTAVIDERTAAARIARLPTPPRLHGREFADACVAAQALLPASGASGQVARAQTAAGVRVFFAGVQVCPWPQAQDMRAPIFSRRDDGALLEVPFNGSRGWSHCGQPCDEQQRSRMAEWWRVRLHDRGTRGLAPPAPVIEQSPGAAQLYTRRGEIWLAGGDGGLYRHDGSRWWHYDGADGFAAGNRIAALMEDARGDIWVAGQGHEGSGRGRQAGAPLHRWRAGVWRHYTPGDGLASWSAEALAPVPGGGALVATTGGVSLVDDTGIRSRSSEQLGDASFVLAIAADDAGRWWLGHGSFRVGLSISLAGSVGRVSTRQGLFDDRVRRIAHDGQGQVWLLDEEGRVAVYPRSLLLQRAGLASGPEG